jgi:hypothetical protein
MRWLCKNAIKSADDISGSSDSVIQISVSDTCHSINIYIGYSMDMPMDDTDSADSLGCISQDGTVGNGGNRDIRRNMIDRMYGVVAVVGRKDSLVCFDTDFNNCSTNILKDSSCCIFSHMDGLIELHSIINCLIYQVKCH